MAIASLKDLYLDELNDLFDAELQIVRALQRLAEAAHGQELRAVLARHSEESRLHLARLDLIFTHWGERLRAQPCVGLTGIVQEADERVHEVTTDEARDAAIISAVRRIEHYEMAAYSSARTYARQLSRIDDARLLQETIDDESRTERRLMAIAEAHLDDPVPEVDEPGPGVAADGVARG